MIIKPSKPLRNIGQKLRSDFGDIMKEYILPKKTLLLWQIRAVAVGFVLLGVCAYFSFTMKPFLIATAVIVLLFAGFVIWYLPKFFDSCKIQFINGSVVIKRGVFIKNTHILPFSRLIYTQTLVTPIAKFFGLTALTLKAARSHIYIPEMLKEDAEELLEAISRGES